MNFGSFEERVYELMESLQRDQVPSVVRIQDVDNLPILHFAILQILDRGQEDPTVKAIAAVIGRSESRTSRVVDALVRRDLVERYEDAADRRARRVRLRPEGVAYLARFRTAQMETQSGLWKHLTEQEKQELLHALELYAKATRRAREERDRTL